MFRLLFLLSAAALSSSYAEIVVHDVKEFDAAVKKAAAGGTIIMAKGEWRDVNLRFHGTGTDDKPITLSAEQPGQTILTGTSRLRIAGEHLAVTGLWFKDPSPANSEVIELRIDSKHSAHFCQVTNCAVTQSAPVDRGATKCRWISLYGSHNLVDHCHLEGKATPGTTLVVWLTGDEDGKHILDANYFGHRPPLGENGGETIRISDSADWNHNAKCIIKNNFFEHCNGEAEIISNKCCENVYFGNTFLECEGALTLRIGHRCRVEGNVFIGHHKKRTGGVRIIGEDHHIVDNYFEDLEGDDSRSVLTFMNAIPDSPVFGYFQVKRALVEKNTIVGCAHPFLIGLRHDDTCTLPPLDCRIENNLVQSEKATIIDAREDLKSFQWKANIIFGKELGLLKNPGILWQKVLMSPSEPDQLKIPSDALVTAGAPRSLPITRRSKTGTDWIPSTNK